MTTIAIPSILLVDDDEIDAESVKRSFRRQRVATPLIHALDGLEALALLRGQPGIAPLPKPYIVLLDINMPRMNGLEFLRELRLDSNLKSTVVFVLTTSTNPNDQIAAYQKRIAGYILKNNVGQDFADAFQLLDIYQKLVSLPE